MGLHLRRNIHSKNMAIITDVPLLPIMAGSPIHVAMPRTLEPGLMSASSTKHLPAFSDPTSIVFHHFCQPVGHTIPALTLIWSYVNILNVFQYVMNEHLEQYILQRE